MSVHKKRVKQQQNSTSMPQQRRPQTQLNMQKTGSTKCKRVCKEPKGRKLKIKKTVIENVWEKSIQNSVAQNSMCIPICICM